MMKKLITFLKIGIPCLFISLIYSNAYAQKIKIKKAKGTSAIIESSIPLEEGQVYDLVVESIAQEVDYKSMGLKPRQNSFSFGGTFQNLSGSNYQNTNTSLQLRYGWNFSYLEFGFISQLSYEDLGGGATNFFQGGGYLDYNFISNRDPKYIIYGMTTDLIFGSKQFPESTGGGSAVVSEINAGGFVTWFLNKTTTAVRSEVFFDFQQISTTTKQNNVSGIGSRVLFLFYY